VTELRWGPEFASGDAMRTYDDVMRPRMFDPWAAVLLDEAALAPGERVLDVGTGPGTVARLAAERVGAAGRVVGVDLSPAMLAIARAKPTPDGAAAVEYVRCTADALPVPDASFDVLTCQQVLQFVPDRVAAVAEMRRATRRDGRLVLAVWSELEESPMFAALADGVREVLGPQAAQAYRNGPYGFPEAGALADVLRAAGWREVEVRPREAPMTFEGGAPQLLLALVPSPIAADVAALDRDGFARLVAAVADAAAPLTDDDGAIRAVSVSNVATAAA
jgi:ubiquinone/menaquinone biosynthesis C-methylase UbiE